MAYVGRKGGIGGLGARVFRAVEREQGYAFISDAIEELPDAKVELIVRGALTHARRVVRILAKCLREAEGA